MTGKLCTFSTFEFWRLRTNSRTARRQFSTGVNSVPGFSKNHTVTNAIFVDADCSASERSPARRETHKRRLFPFITSAWERKSISNKKIRCYHCTNPFLEYKCDEETENSNGWILFDVSPNSLSLYNKACDVAAVRIYCLIFIVERLFVSKVFLRPLFSWYLSVPLIGGTSFSRRGAFYFLMSLVFLH